MSDDENELPVYLCAPGEQKPEDMIGKAASKSKAAKLVRAETGDADFRASDVYFSPTFSAYFSEEG